jgi:hypothetical protein
MDRDIEITQVLFMRHGIDTGNPRCKDKLINNSSVPLLPAKNLRLGHKALGLLHDSLWQRHLEPPNLKLNGDSVPRVVIERWGLELCF